MAIFGIYITLEVQPPFLIGWFPNHHYFSRGLSSSKKNHHFLKWWQRLPGYIKFLGLVITPFTTIVGAHLPAGFLFFSNITQ